MPEKKARSLVCHLFLRIDRRGIIETGPAHLSVSRSARLGVYGCVPCKHYPRFRDSLIGHSRAHEGAAATYAFGIDMGILLGMASIVQRSHNGSRRRSAHGADARANSGRGEPACSTGNCWR